MRCAAIIAKLRLAPVIMINTNFGGDNHQDAGLLNETNETLAMVAALDGYWQAIHDLNVADDVLFARLDVFGRSPHSDGNGRNHYGDFVSGLMIGTIFWGGRWMDTDRKSKRRGSMPPPVRQWTQILMRRIPYPPTSKPS